MDPIEILVIFMVWLIAIGAFLLRTPGHGVRSLVAPWLILTVVSMAILFVVFFMVSYGLLFLLGKEAAGVGVILGAVALVATPVVWAIVLRRRAHRAEAQAQPGA